MNEENLERLLMDRALGALPVEVGALLDAYLAHDVQAAARAREFETATDVARRALKDERVPELPPFPHAALQRAEQSRRRLVVVRKVASLAACVLIGVGLGAWMVGDSQPAEPRVFMGGAEGVHEPVVAARGVGDAPGFWSVQRLYERAREKRRTRPVHLEWDSAVRRPTLGGAT